jgi:RNase P/RNase MRP subunit p30
MSFILIEEENFDKARKRIRDSKSNEIIFASKDDELSRKIIEKEKINILLIKQKGRKDKQKQRNSGLNSVMAKIAKKKNIKIGMDIDEIMETKGKEKAEILARIEQNIRLCNKEKLNIKFITFNKKYERNNYDLKTFGLVLGMSTTAIKDL